MAAGLPMEGEYADSLHAGDVADKEAPTCRFDAQAGSVLREMRESGETSRVVVDDHGIVLGVLPVTAEAGEQTLVADAMRIGPSAVRADKDLKKLLESMEEGGLKAAIVTDPDGHLLGIASLVGVRRALKDRGAVLRQAPPKAVIGAS